MLSGVGVVCFASSYAVAWALEASRLLFRSGVRGAVMLGFAAAGLFAHTAFLYYRAVSAEGAPLSSERDWYFVASWALAAVYLFLAVAHPKIPFGLFLLPLALGLIGAGTFLASPAPLASGSASQAWGAVHGGAILATAVAVLVGFVAGLMYLVQERRLKRRRRPAGRLRLPSQEWLETACFRSIAIAPLLLGVGVFAGMVLNLIRAAAKSAPVPWSDPVVLSAWLLFAWLALAGVFAAVYRPARRGRKTAWLAVAAFAALALALAVGLAVESRHWARKDGGAGEANAKCKTQLAICTWSKSSLQPLAPSPSSNPHSPIPSAAEPQPNPADRSRRALKMRAKASTQDSSPSSNPQSPIPNPFVHPASRPPSLVPVLGGGPC